MTARGRNDRTSVEPGVPEHSITHAALIEYLANAAVLELVICHAGSAYRLEASLSWRSGRSTLVTARGGVREFKSLDTLATFLRTAGIGRTLVRLQLNP